jgi:hypothetical protein
MFTIAPRANSSSIRAFQTKLLEAQGLRKAGQTKKTHQRDTPKNNAFNS